MAGLSQFAAGLPSNAGGQEPASPEWHPGDGATTWWKVAGVDIDRAAPAALIVNRGVEPSILEFVVRDGTGGPAELLRTKDNPVEVEIGAPDITLQSKTLTLKNWWLTSITPAKPGYWRITLKDGRCAEARQGRRPTLAFNIYDSRQGLDAVARQATLDDGQPYTCYRAAQKAMEAFGMTFEPTYVEASCLRAQLPRNLGDSRGGGFPAMDWDADMPLLTEPAGLDIVQLPNGNMTLTDRFTEAAMGLQKYVPLDGSVGPRDIHWSLPKTLVLKLEQRLERQFTCDESASGASGFDFGAVCVIARELPSFEPQNLFHEPLFPAMETTWGITAATIRQRMFKERVIPENVNDTDEVSLAKADWEQWVREHWRRTWRVENGEGLATLADLVMGHLGAAGTTRSERNVYMPYAFMRRDTRVSKFQVGAASLAKIPLTDNVEIDLLRPAPFTAEFGYNHRGDVLFRLNPQPVSQMLRVYPGKLTVPVALGDALDLSGPTRYLAELAPDAVYAAGWFAYVVYHGLLIADRPDLGLKRMHEVTRPLFANGKVERAEYFVRDLTANWTLRAVGQSAVQLANEAEIEQRADEIQAMVLRAFEPGRSGPFVTGGVAAIVDGKYWVRGNIRSMAIVLGATAPHSVETEWQVMPGVRPVYTEDMAKAMQGPPIRELA